MEEQSKEQSGTFGTYLDTMKAGKKQASRDDMLQDIIVQILSYLIQIDGPILLKDLIEQSGVEEGYFMDAFSVMEEQGLVKVEGEKVRLAPEILDRL